MTHCNIHFRVKFFTNYSETVSVLGNVEPLGGWNTQLAFPLKTNQSLYPYWESENPIQVPSGTKLEFKFAIMKDGQLHRWENLPLGENRTYRSRYYQVTLEFSEAVPQFSEDVNKRFVSSASLENLDEFKRVKKGKKVFNPFITAQDSLSSDSWEGSSADKCSSDDLNSFGNNDASPLKEGIEDSQFDKDPEMSIEPNMSESRANKLNTLANKTADLQAIIKSGNHEPEVLSLLYHHYKTQNNLPKNKPTCILNHESEDEGSSPDLEDEEAEFSSHDQVFYVSFKLPINIRQLDPNATEINKRWEIKVNMNTHLGSVYRLCKQQTKAVFWIGWIGVFIDQNEQEALSKHLYKEYNCVPIFLEEETCSKFLYEYCNQFLHDAFFNILDMKAVFSQETYVESYNDVNKLYTEKILEYANLQSLILIQDYHLMMIPKYLCQSNPKYTLGYIFETPFPTLEVFKVFYNKKELLESLLCCDLICFNTSEYIKMFTNISAKLMNIYLACERGGHMHLKNGGRKVYVRVAFPSVDPSYISDVLSKQPYIDIKASVQEKYASKTLIVGIAHFTKIEGIESLIQSIKSLFESEKDQSYHFCLLNFDDVYKHDQDNAEKKAFFIKIQNEIDSINNSMKQMGLKNEMEVIGGIISEENKLALMSVSKLLIAFSPYLDNDLHILEYLFSKVSNRPGSIILSEFSHGHKHLNSLIKVNPFNKIEIMEGIRKGLTRNPETASYLMELDRGLVTNYTSWHRLQGLLNDVKKAQQIKSRLNLLRVDESNEFKLIVVNEAFQSLDQQKLLQNFKVSKRRVIILGYEETLSTGTASTRKQLFSEGNLTLGTGISSDDMDIIRALTLISDISLYIISSKKVDVLAKEFESVPNANLIAENGFSYRIARQSKWFNIFHCDWSWKSIVQRIMQNYANRTEGVKVEVKESSLTWDHSDVRTEIAKIQELELINHLSTVLTHVKNLEVVKERRCVEVKPAGISKGLISELILEKCRIMEGQYPDFILCLGATSKDEAMFEKMEQIASENEDFERINLFTCIPKKKPSNARYYLQGIPETFSMLRMLAENC